MKYVPFFFPFFRGEVSFFLKNSGPVTHDLSIATQRIAIAHPKITISANTKCGTLQQASDFWRMTFE